MTGATILACVVCHGVPTMIFAVHKTSVTAFCGPTHAAQCGLEPWLSSDLVTRALWPEPEPGGSSALRKVHPPNG